MSAPEESPLEIEGVTLYVFMQSDAVGGAKYMNPKSVPDWAKEVWRDGTDPPPGWWSLDRHRWSPACNDEGCRLVVWGLSGEVPLCVFHSVAFKGLLETPSDWTRDQVRALLIDYTKWCNDRSK